MNVIDHSRAVSRPLWAHLAYLLAGSLLWFAAAVRGLHEDQIGMYDWHQPKVGMLKDVFFEEHLLLVGTEENVVAALSVQSGDIVWRHVLPKEETISRVYATSKGLFSFSKGSNSARLWGMQGGELVWDVSVTLGNTERELPHVTEHVVVRELEGNQLVLAVGNNIVALHLANGAVLWNVRAPRSCDSAKHISLGSGSILYLACESRSDLIDVFKMALGDDGRTISEWTSVFSKLRGPWGVNIQPVSLPTNEGLGLVVLDDRAGKVRVLDCALDTEISMDIRASDANVHIRTLEPFDPTDEPTDQITATTSDNQILILRITKDEYNRYSVLVVGEFDGSLANQTFSHCQKESAIAPISSTSKNGGRIQTSFSSCSGLPRCKLVLDLDEFREEAIENVRLRLRDDMALLQLIVLTDGSIHMFENEKLLWFREEGLASIVQVKFVALTEHSEEEDFPVIPSVVERWLIQLHHARDSFGSMLALSTSKPALAQSTNSHYFGFDKMLVGFAENGKIYGIHGESGAVVWRRKIGNAKILISVRPQPALGGRAIVMVIVQETSGQVAIWLCAETGTELTRQQLTSKVSRYFLLPESVEISTGRIVATIDETGVIGLLPDTEDALQALENFELPLHFSDVDPATNEIKGFALKIENGSLNSKSTWNIKLGAKEKILSYQTSVDGEPIHSPVHILGDNSLLTKYISPHVLTVVSEERKDGEPTLRVYVIDGVNGKILHRVRHRNAEGPAKVIQSENWVYYCYWNTDKSQTEIGVISLYEGVIGKRALNLFKRPAYEETFTSFQSGLPVVLQKVFAFPTSALAIAPTITARGITSKHILVALDDSRILSLDRRLIDPRRPLGPPSPEEVSEGLAQYAQYVPIMPTKIISYNRSVEGVRNLVTSASNLESTSILFAYGLDHFYARVMPSKTFDLLASDFNYPMLVLLTGGLFIAQMVGRITLHKKKLRNAWA